ncbi:aconitase family protein [Aspergillus lucknowensis]|uniref:Aconitase family protein n=1 Tax=Aspergillus lucknowensis TaxID=176173 RepID=A0ABR4LNI8_9EURO
MADTKKGSLRRLLQILQETRNIRIRDTDEQLDESTNIVAQITALQSVLSNSGHHREAGCLCDILPMCSQPPELGGLAITDPAAITPEQESEIVFLVSAWLEALNSADRAKKPPTPLAARPAGRRGMTLSEKIFAHHEIGGKGCVAPGDLIRVDVDWVLASEASWQGMESTYDALGQPGIFRNDRFWLAGDHVVDPRVNDQPEVRALIDASERAKHVFKMTDYQGTNRTILHTEFYRQRVQPGMIVIGSDSHTCSSGALGCLAIGLGAADVTLPLVTGETWFKVPGSVNVRLVGRQRPGIEGKDIILYILQQLKRDTVAADRIVEFSGPGAQYLSCDARFAICNMTAELGGITGIFVPDLKTHNFVQKRMSSRHKEAGVYFRPDDDAQYAATYEINLENVRPFIAKYPNPDDVVPVVDAEGMPLDGCFIGACTTTEEDLILAALVLNQGLQSGLRPVPRGKRKMVPGSTPILHRLGENGMTDIYEAAGFEIGVPGCSYCVGMSADQAAPGEIWLSSQNRNFKNRMGKGSIGHLASAATVAASSFGMSVRDPTLFLDVVDLGGFLGKGELSGSTDSEGGLTGPTYVEPREGTRVGNISEMNQGDQGSTECGNPQTNIIAGRIQRLGDFVDTDALAPADFLMDMKTNEIAGAHCLQHTHPEFRQRVRDGFNVVVAGKAFGCGSSREQAVMALLGCGVQCVLATSFAFIFQRNMPNLGLLGIIMADEGFYEAAIDGVEINIDLSASTVDVAGRRFGFKLSQMERELFEHGGISSAFRKFGKRLFEQMTRPKNLGGTGIEPELAPELRW